MTAAATGRAFGKIILIGEHFVLDGIDAIAMPLPGFRTEVTWHAKHSPITIDSDMSLSAEALSQTERMLQAAAIHAGHVPLGHVQIRSTVPLHRGFGSSAALAVATLRALAQLRPPAGAPLDILAAARAVEHVVHGKSSGLDPATAMGDGAVRFGRGEVVCRIVAHEALRPARWVLTDVGTAPSTATAIGRANDARGAMDSVALSALKSRISGATALMAKGLRTGDLTALADAIGTAATGLLKLDVVDERMKEAMARAMAAGAVATKQSGAGLGGAVLALAPNAEIAETIAEGQRNAGLPTWILEIAP
ncbi:MAG: hypothetical protein KC502_15335 [Myxococcales bacterium]|nr:hypothetical protein [Myxococcales bacterium]